MVTTFSLKFLQFKKPLLFKKPILGLVLFCIYFVPYSYFVALLPLISSSVFILTRFPFRFKRTPFFQLLYKLIFLYILLGFVIAISGLINGIALADTLLSVYLFCFPIFTFLLFLIASKLSWSAFVQVNQYYVYVQIPFFIFQLLTRDGTTDDWFKGSMMESQNTQTIAFVFFVNFWLYFDAYIRTKNYFCPCILSLIFALATNTNLLTFAFILSWSIFVLYKMNVKKVMISLFAVPIILGILYMVISNLPGINIENIKAPINALINDPTSFRDIGKIDGLFFAIEKWAESFKTFLLGVGPGVAASRLVLYKLETANTTLSFLSPLTSVYYDFTAGHFLRSNLHRPWSDITAFLLEGGLLVTMVIVTILYQIRRLLGRSPQLTALFAFFFFALFVEHPMDNAKMASFFFIVVLYLAGSRLFYETENSSCT